MSSPTIVRLVLQVDYKPEHNKVFEHGALNLSNIAAERPQRYRREVLSTGLLDHNNHWYRTNYTLDMFKGTSGDRILVQLLAVACNMFLSEDLHDEDRRFIERQLFRLRSLEEGLIQGIRLTMEEEAFLAGYQEGGQYLMWKMELVSMVDTIRTMA
jgi:hypothetical protein